MSQSVRNEAVKVGLRSGNEGLDFIVPSKGKLSTRLARGWYGVYYQYSVDPGSLYQGDSLRVGVGDGVELKIVADESGGKGIRKVR